DGIRVVHVTGVQTCALPISVKRLEEAEAKLRDWQRAAAEATRGAVMPAAEPVLQALCDDLNFHRASVAIDALAKEARAEQVAARSEARPGAAADELVGGRGA